MRAWIVLAAVLALTAQPGLSRVCQGNAELSGPYGFVASRTALVGAPSAFTGAFLNAGAATTGTGTGTGAGPGAGPGGGTGAGPGAVTLPGEALQGAGGLVSGATSLEPFSRVGTVFLSGDGAVALNSGLPSLSSVQVGTYTVNSDCSVTMSLNNTFAFPAVTPGPGTPGAAGRPRFASASTADFAGIAAFSGDEIDLVQVGTNLGTRLTLRRTLRSQSCNNGTLTGSYGFLMEATTAAAGTGGAVTFNPSVLAGVLNADGSGTFLPSNLAVSSTPASQQLTGTYTVNADCTGTARISSAAAGATPANVDFVLVRAGQQVSGAFGNVGVSNVELLAAPSGRGMFGSGMAVPQ